ncbi:MAG: acetyl-CoA carboxylase biotin carboxyl carrier protein subunit [Planctomycetes bacterium]|nr:acetyl-CoA carboxylase biotin carboxyl carrier protein subunit [Planctomycetota bacterium]
MPGIVLLVAVKEGDRVARGDLLLTLEAMKIEHEVRAAAAGTVRTVRVEGGQRVEAGEELVEIVPEAEAEADRGGGGERR